jgi:hypothetical protein
LTTPTFTTLAQLLALGLRPDLQGPRTRGSLTEIGLEDLDGNLPVTEFTPENEALVVPVARYFRLEAPALQGRIGAVQMGDLTRAQLALLRSRSDIDPSIPEDKAREHGVEFYLDVEPENADLPSVSHATLIVGPVDDQGTLGFWTWFPGDATGTTMARNKVTTCPINLVGVKLHNG